MSEPTSETEELLPDQCKRCGTTELHCTDQSKQPIDELVLCDGCYFDELHEQNGHPKAIPWPKQIKWELELCYFGMGPSDAEGNMTLAAAMEDAVVWDVELHLRLEQTGQVEILFERTFHNEHDATVQYTILQDMFEPASENTQPEH
tara:strand:+ start:645 stop:1085 length:441 start_codon:yes stop_codon:yes gene_type:complete